ncbi:hypothetical protein AOT82_1299 [Psychrobacter sp. AntiMn-1]|nr:hypothetical protein AOT82_1299 [Psychrobacter sp. AntiMn-1]
MGHGIILDGIFCSRDFTIALFMQKASNNPIYIVVIRGCFISSR